MSAKRLEELDADELIAAIEAMTYMEISNEIKERELVVEIPSWLTVLNEWNE